ncbi:Citrate synthase 2 [compost metagenome]
MHGGAGQACLELYQRVGAALDQGTDLTQAATQEVGRMLDSGTFIPGFGHRFHPVDPRAGKLLALVETAREQGHVDGRHARIAVAVEAALMQLKGKRLPMNIDGATAVVYGELGFAPELSRGLFVLSRSVGILAHAWEQMSMNARIKGPMPPSVPYSYVGPCPRAKESEHGG